MAERLRYIRVDDEVVAFRVTVQLSGGGVFVQIPRRATASDVLHALRAMAHALEDGLKIRAGLSSYADPPTVYTTPLEPDPPETP